jgi:hypothetical protein
MPTLKELIEKLPDELQPLATTYGNLWINATTAQLECMVNLLIDGKLSKAFEIVVSNMPTSQLVAELDRVNTRLAEVNADKASYIEAQRQIIREAVTVGINMLLASAESVN